MVPLSLQALEAKRQREVQERQAQVAEAAAASQAHANKVRACHLVLVCTRWGYAGDTRWCIHARDVCGIRGISRQCKCASLG